MMIEYLSLHLEMCDQFGEVAMHFRFFVHNTHVAYYLPLEQKSANVSSWLTVEAQNYDGSKMAQNHDSSYM